MSCPQPALRIVEGHVLSAHDHWRLFLWAIKHDVPAFDDGRNPDGIDAREALELDLPA